MRSVETTGRTIDEAVHAALAQLGVARQFAEVEVLVAPVRGLFGLIGQRDARVRVTISQGKVEFAREFIETIVAKLRVSVDIELNENEREANLVLSGPDVSLLIGRRGQTLNALEFLTNVAASRVSEERERIYLDAEGYRKRRAQLVVNIAKRAAQRVRRSGRSSTMEPMTAAERRIVHLALKRLPGVVTRSEGAEPFRRVIIMPTKQSHRVNV